MEEGGSDVRCLEVWGQRSEDQKFGEPEVMELEVRGVSSRGGRIISHRVKGWKVRGHGVSGQEG